MGKCKKKKKKFHRWYKNKGKDLLLVFEFLTGVFELIIAFVEWINHWGALAIAIPLLLVYSCAEYRFDKDIKEDKREYKKRDEQLRNELIKGETEGRRKEISGQEEELKDKHRRKQKFIKKCRLRIRIVFLIAALISVFAFFRGWPVINGEKGTEEMVRNQSSAEGNKDGKSILGKVTEDNEETEESAAGGTIENATTVNGEKGTESAEKIADITFILDDPDRLRTLSREMAERVFYVSCADHEIVGGEVDSHVDAIFEVKREDTSGNASVIEQGVIKEASDQEAIFIEDKKRAAECKSRNDIEGWRNHIPHSGNLENNIMSPREQFWNLEEPIFNSEMAFLMANSNKLLADEYKLQGGRPETVIYYWVECIVWTELGLSYANLSKEERDEYYPYLKARYKDIHDFIEAHENEPWAQEDTYKEIKEKADAIYLNM